MMLADELRMWAEADVLDMDSIEDLLTRAADEIARLSGDLAAAREAVEFSKKMFAHGNEHGFSDAEMAMINERLDAVRAKLDKGA